MPRYAKRRDVCERGIIDALIAVGASVTQLDAKGAPDLLVGFRGATILLEAKDAHGSFKRNGKKSQSGLRATQDEWWARWTGAAPIVVTTPDEALRAIGAVVE